MSLLNVNNSIVVVIDLQGKLMDAIYRPQLVIRGTIRLLKLAEMFRVPVILSEQYAKGLGRTHPDVLAAFEQLTTEKRYIDKTSFGCCGDAGFNTLLHELRPNITPGERQVVIAGIEAHVCVMQTVLELMRQQNQVHVCWECVSGRGEEYRRHALDRMQHAGATITNHESVAFEWARDKNHACFKAISNLLKEGQLT